MLEMELIELNEHHSTQKAALQSEINGLSSEREHERASVEAEHATELTSLKEKQEAAKRQHAEFMENATAEYQRLQAEFMQAKQATDKRCREEIESEKEL